MDRERFLQTINSGSYEQWVEMQIEPDQSLLRSGNAKRHVPLFIEMRNELAKMREEMGTEAFEKWNKEFNEWELNRYKDEHDL